MAKFLQHKIPIVYYTLTSRSCFVADLHHKLQKLGYTERKRLLFFKTRFLLGVPDKYADLPVLGLSRKSCEMRITYQ